jgi:hypothetical protein
MEITTQPSSTPTSARRISQRSMFIGSCLMMLLCAAALAGRAYAYVPSGALISQINFKNFVIKTNDFALWSSAFANQLVGPDGISGPDGTPDGFGAFSFYTGSGGTGAIYAFTSGGSTQAYGVYGAILSSWASLGYETGRGYPTSDEFTAGSNELSWGCQSGDRAQWFWSFSRNEPWLACFHWANGVTSWIRAVR